MPADIASDLRLAIESVLFVAHGPVDVATLARVADVSNEQVDDALKTMASDYKGKGLRIQRTGEAAQFVSAPEAASYVENFLGIDESQTISPAALETLAIIAYKQPIARSTIERIRGVNCDYAVAVLKARSLITEVGRAASPGRPYLYGTTFRFLEHFGLEKPEDLPPLPELDKALEAAGGQDLADFVPLPSQPQLGEPSAQAGGPGENAMIEELSSDESMDEAEEDESPQGSDDAITKDQPDDDPDDEPPDDDPDDAPPWE